MLGTDQVAEGSSNLYFTNARADARIAAASLGDLSDVNTTGVADGELLGFDVASGLWGPVVGGVGGANAGIGSNVVQAVKSNTQASSLASGGFVAVVGMSASITPTANTSKVLVLVNMNLADSRNERNQSGFRIMRSTTAVGIGNAGGASQLRLTSAFSSATTSNIDRSNVTAFFLDSPGTAAAVTYTVELANTDGNTRTVFVNRSQADNNSVAHPRTISTLTVIEVAA